MLPLALPRGRYDRFPVSNQDAAYLTALRAQVELGDLDQSQPVGDTYNVVVVSAASPCPPCGHRVA